MDQAKVALIGVERSVEKLENNTTFVSGLSKRNTHLLVVLEQLRSDADEYFPKARNIRTPRVRQLIAGPKGLQRKSRNKK